MSQTTQVVSIPLSEGTTSARISSTVWSVGGAKIENNSITFAAGPDMIGGRYVRRSIVVQPASKAVPTGYKNAGEICHNGNKMKVLVELPD